MSKAHFKLKLGLLPFEVKVESVCKVLSGEATAKVKKSVDRQKAATRKATKAPKKQIKRRLCPVPYKVKVEAIRRVLNGESRLEVRNSVGREGGTPESTLRGWFKDDGIQRDALILINRCHKSADASTDSGIASADSFDSSIAAEIRNASLRRTNEKKPSTNDSSRRAAKRKRVTSDSTDDGQPAKRRVVKKRANSSKHQNQQVADSESMDCVEVLKELDAKKLLPHDFFVYFSEILQ